MKKLFVLLAVSAFMAMITISSTASAGNNDEKTTIQQQTVGIAVIGINNPNPGDPIVKSNSKSPVKTGINIGFGGVQSNSKSSVKYGTHKSNNNFQKRKYHKILSMYKRKSFWNKIF